MRPIFLSCLAASLMAGAAAANPPEGVVRLDILPGWRNADGTHMAGLRIALAEGWKTYWRAPGDAGIPPSFDWAGSENIGAVSFHWPVPDVSVSNGMRSIVYHDEVVIPMEFALEDGAADARIRGAVQIGVCDEICVPMHVRFDAVLSADGGRDPQILAALLDRPRTEAEAGVSDVDCDITPTDGGLHIATTVTMPRLAADEVVVIEAGNQEVWVSEPDSQRTGNTLLAEADMIHVTGGAFLLDRSAVRITVLAGGQSVDIRGCD